MKENPLKSKSISIVEEISQHYNSYQNKNSIDEVIGEENDFLSNHDTVIKSEISAT